MARQFVSVKREVTMASVAPYRAVSVVLYGLHWMVYLCGEIIILSDIRVDFRCHIRVVLIFALLKEVSRLLVKVAV